MELFPGKTVNTMPDILKLVFKKDTDLMHHKKKHDCGSKPPEELKDDSKDAQKVDTAGQAEPASAAPDDGKAKPQTPPAPPKTDAEIAAEKIEELKARLAETEDKALRLRADMENQRKRFFKELSEARTFTMIDSVMPMLTVFDHFKMAVESAEKGHDSKILFDGMKIITSEFKRALTELGIEEINDAGKDFDPKIHEAVAKQHSPDVPEGKIILQMRSGYRLGERLIRPCSVIVSDGPEKPEQPKEQNDKSSEQ